MMYRLRKLFKRKLRVTFHMKSGAELTIKCDQITTKVDADQALTSYVINGGVGLAHYIRLDDISAIMVVK